MGFRVIIVGAGLAGLVTALAMEQLGIDFLLLEAHETIGPRIGGAIILMPGGLRILDQLGCYEAIIRQERGSWLYKCLLERGVGLPLTPPGYAHQHAHQRLGYPSLQIRRDVLLRTLVGKLRLKDRLLVGVKVKRIETDNDGVRVYGADGSCHSGDIVAGTDGVHSVVRAEMWRLRSLSSAPPSSSESADLSRYRVHSRALVCTSATPRTAAGKEGVVEYRTVKDGTILLIDTSGNRTVMLMLQKLPLADAAAGSSIRFGAEEEAALVEDYAKLPIHGGDFTVSDLYSRRLGPPSLILVQDYLAQTWSFDRLLLLGDSACKSSVYAGQNSSLAMESAAYFANCLFNSLRQESRASLSRVQVAETLSQFRRDSRARINFIFNLASRIESSIFKISALPKYLPLHLVTPRIGATLNADFFVFASSGAPRIKGLPMPPRPRFTPFDDELPAKPVQSNWLLWVPRILVAFLMTALLLSACYPSLTIVPPGLLPAGGLVSPEVAFVVNLFPVITAWLAESRRFGTSDPLGCVCLYGLLYLRLGPASITPLFGLSSLLLSRKTIDGRRMPPAAAKAILPSVCLGYALPTLAALLPMGHGRSLARTIAVAWPASPSISALLLALLGRHRCPPECVQASEVPIGKSHSLERKAIGLSEAQIVERYRLLDVGSVKLAHAFGFVLCSASAIFSSLGSLPSSSTSPQSFADMSSVPLALIANDIQERGLRIQFVSIAVYSLYMLWTLRAGGLVATKSSVVILLGAVAILMALGPGAMLSASMWWHEHATSRLSEPVPRNLLDETKEEDCITSRP